MAENRLQDEEEGVLLARIARADTIALELLYHRYRPRLHRFLRAFGCSLAELDDLCNETFYTVWKKALEFDGRSRLSTWIFGIARNKARDHLRKRRRLETAHTDAALEHVPDTKLSHVERIDLAHRLEVALEHLPPEQRAVIELAFNDGLSYQEIAVVMDCPESTVKTRVFHARRKLRAGFPEFDTNDWRQSQ